MAKADIQRGFYHLKVDKSSWKYLNFYFKGRLHRFRRLPMGLCTSPGFFSWITSEINAWLAASGVDAHIVYLDDFILYGHTPESCASALALLKEICQRVGIQLAGEGKTSEKPEQVIIALGIRIDLLAFTISIPADRMIKLGIFARLVLNAAKRGAKVPAIMLESIAGRMVWVSYLNPMMRLYTCHMDRLAHKGAGRDIMRHVPKGARKALGWLVKALDEGTIVGEALCPNSAEYATRTAVITSDATKSSDATTIAFRLGTAIQVRVALPDCLEEDITALELLGITSAIRRWGPRLKGFRLICGCDTAAVVDWIDSGRSRREDIRKLLRKIYRAEKRYELRIIARWLPRWYNYRNDRIAGLEEPEAEALDAKVILETARGRPLTALRETERISSNN